MRIADRRAHYACVLALVRHESDPEPIIADQLAPANQLRRLGKMIGMNRKRALSDFDAGKSLSVPDVRYKVVTALAQYVPAGVLARFQSMGRK